MNSELRFEFRICMSKILLNQSLLSDWEDLHCHRNMYRFNKVASQMQWCILSLKLNSLNYPVISPSEKAKELISQNVELFL